MAAPRISKEKLEELAIKALEENQKIINFSDLSLYLPVHRATMYNHGLDKNDTIRDLINNNRTRIKEDLRRKWQDSKIPTCEIALYRLCAETEEIERLNSNTKELNKHVEDLSENIEDIKEELAELLKKTAVKK